MMSKNLEEGSVVRLLRAEIRSLSQLIKANMRVEVKYTNSNFP